MAKKDEGQKVTVAGRVTSVKPKSDQRRGHYMGVVVVNEDEQAYWFPWDDDPCPEKGDDIEITGSIRGASDDGKMIFLEDVEIDGLTHKCDHTALIRQSPGRYACSDCGIVLKVS